MMFSIMTPDDVLEQIRRRLHSERLRVNMTQGEVASFAGISTLTVNRFENGGQTSIMNVLKIAEAVGALGLFADLAKIPVATSIAETLSEYQPQRQRASRAKSRSGGRTGRDNQNKKASGDE